MIFPQKMMVIREPGHWNLDAAKLNSKYYIPVDNQPPQLTPPSKGYYDYIQSKQSGTQVANLDVSKVIVTGFMQKSEEQDAKATLKTGQTLTYDPYLGWLAVPTELLQKGGSIDQPIVAPATVTPEAPAPNVNPTVPAVPAGVTPAAPTSPDAARSDEVKKLIQDAFNGNK
jgi:hypothetical protein